MYISRTGKLWRSRSPWEDRKSYKRLQVLMRDLSLTIIMQTIMAESRERTIALKSNWNHQVHEVDLPQTKLSAKSKSIQEKNDCQQLFNEYMEIELAIVKFVWRPAEAPERCFKNRDQPRPARKHEPSEMEHTIDILEIHCTQDIIPRLEINRRTKKSGGAASQAAQAKKLIARKLQNWNLLNEKKGTLKEIVGVG